MGVKKGWSSFMDRRVKERLVGATILVVLIVLIVPELLSGPKQSQAPATTLGTSADTVRNVTVDLATSKATADTDTPSASPAGASPDGGVGGNAGAGMPAAVAPPVAPVAPVAQVAHPPPTVSTLQAQPSSPVENGASSPTLGKANRANSAALAAAATPDGAHHHWAVQLGSFASQSNAERLVHQLQGQGFTAYIMSGGAGTGSLYRVRIGPLADRAGAERMISRLSKVGHSASVVSP